MLRTLALEHRAGIAKQGFLPVGHLRGVELIAPGYLMNWLLLTQRLQRYFAFEFSGEFTSLFH